MKKFVHTNDFRDLNVAFALDEGMANPKDEFPLFYAERCIWRKYKIYYIFTYIFFAYFIGYCLTKTR